MAKLFLSALVVCFATCKPMDKRLHADAQALDIKVKLEELPIEPEWKTEHNLAESLSELQRICTLFQQRFEIITYGYTVAEEKSPEIYLTLYIVCFNEIKLLWDTLQKMHNKKATRILGGAKETRAFLENLVSLFEQLHKLLILIRTKLTHTKATSLAEYVFISKTHERFMQRAMYKFAPEWSLAIVFNRMRRFEAKSFRSRNTQIGAAE